MDSRVVSIIEGYMFDLFEPGRFWPEYEFRKRSYARWATMEILTNIERHPNILPIEVVKKFVHKTEEFSGDHDERSDSFIFLVAHDVATDILDILRAMN